MDIAAAHRPHLARWARSRTVARICGSQAAFTLNQSFQIIFLQQGWRHGAARRRSRQRGGNQHCLETARWAADPKPTCSGEQKTLDNPHNGNTISSVQRDSVLYIRGATWEDAGYYVCEGVDSRGTSVFQVLGLFKHC